MSRVELAIQVQEAKKAFGATIALNSASFSVERGTVHALLGENGAGKSTMVKLLSGLMRPDTGEIRVDGHAVRLRDARDAHRLGLQTAFQELTLIPDLSVLRNVLLPYEPVSFTGILRARAARRAVAAHFEKLGLGAIDLNRDVRELDLVTRQQIEIARAIFRQPRVLFLDEATSTLSGSGIEWLAGQLDALKTAGTTIVFISHRMPEVRRFCDSLTVLRNGRDVGSFQTDAVSDKDLIELIMGRSLAATFPPKAQAQARDRQPVLSVRNVRAAPHLDDCSFDLHPGEILGVSGLQGMGQHALFLALFGAVPITGGTMRLDGKPLILGSPQNAIRSGIGLVPEERKTEGLFLKMTGRENITVPVLSRLTKLGMISSRAEMRTAAGVMDRVQVDRRALFTPAGAFSGGNQQKLVLAKWLVTRTRILLLFDPCRGVDVGTKHEIYLMIRAYADAGGAVLLYSSEIPELVNLSDRVMVMYRGRVVKQITETSGQSIEVEVMRAALGELRSEGISA